VPESSGYETYSLLSLFGAGIGKRKSYSGMGHAPLHFITQRGPYQDGESVLDMRYDVRTVQILIEEALAGRTQYFDTRWEYLDLLRPNRSFGTTVRPLIYRKWLPAGKIERGNDMSVTNGSAIVTSHDARFVGRGLDAGAAITIGGVGYTIGSVPNDYTLNLTAVYAGGTATDVAWEYRRGWGKRDLFCLLEQGPAFDEDVGDVFPSSGYREALRFVAHDPFWYDQEQSETWTITALDALVLDTDGTSQVRAWFGHSRGVGYWFFGGDSVSASIQVVYWGTKGAKPVFTITGPATDPVIDNTTVGARIEMDYVIAAGETVTIDTLALTVTNNFADNLSPHTTGNIATFELSPPPQAPNRINNIFVSFSAGVSGQSAVTMTWRNRDVGLGGG
jgi:hypothetical protein